jgi:hypothetical protein
MALSTNGLRAILVAGLQWPLADVEGYLAALRGRGLLQSGDAPIRTENAVFVLLTLLTGSREGENAADEGNARQPAVHCPAARLTVRHARRGGGRIGCGKREPPAISVGGYEAAAACCGSSSPAARSARAGAGAGAMGINGAGWGSEAGATTVRTPK